jgi:hypothetical protein
MHRITKLYLDTCIGFEKTFLKYLGRPLSLAEKNSLKNAGSLQMLESYSRGIESITSPKEAEKELGELLNLTRLKDYIQFFISKMEERSIEIVPSFEKILIQKGNILDIMILWDTIEEEKLPQEKTNKLLAKFLDEINKRQ